MSFYHTNDDGTARVVLSLLVACMLLCFYAPVIYWINCIDEWRAWDVRVQSHLGHFTPLFFPSLA